MTIKLKIKQKKSMNNCDSHILIYDFLLYLIKFNHLPNKWIDMGSEAIPIHFRTEESHI